VKKYQRYGSNTGRYRLRSRRRRAKKRNRSVQCHKSHLRRRSDNEFCSYAKYGWIFKNDLILPVGSLIGSIATLIHILIDKWSKKEEKGDPQMLISGIRTGSNILPSMSTPHLVSSSKKLTIPADLSAFIPGPLKPTTSLNITTSAPQIWLTFGRSMSLTG